MGSVIGIATGVIMSLMWLFANRSSVETKIVVSIAMITLAVVTTLLVCIASSFTIAEVRHARLNFYFCGIRTQSIPLDGPTTFVELRKIGRLEVLSIHTNGSTYVPNGALQTCEMLNLLRANRVAEQKAA